MALLYSRTAWAAQRTPLGCALATTALPLATMLITLAVSVGTLCVTGVITPMTPNGANSSRHSPLLPLVAAVLRNSTPGTSSRICSFSILWSSRPIFVSSNSIWPHARALSFAICLTSLTMASRSSRESFASFFCASVAAVTASSTEAKRPKRPSPGGGVVPRDSASMRLPSLAGASSPARTPPPPPPPPGARLPRRFMTSATTSWTRVASMRFIRFIARRAKPRAAGSTVRLRLVEGLARVGGAVHDADDHGIRGEVLRRVGHAGAAALHDQDELPLARTDDVDRDDRAARVAKRRGLVRLLVVLDVQGLDDEQLLAV